MADVRKQSGNEMTEVNKMTKENHLKNKNERIDYMKKLKKSFMIVIIILIIFLLYPK